MSEDQIVLSYPKLIKEGSFTPAIYRIPEDREDLDNIFIKALPLPRNKDEILKDYNVRPDSLDSISNTDDRRTLLTQVLNLRKIRFPLPFHELLENEFYNALVLSYRSRSIIKKDEIDIKLQSENQEFITHQLLLGNPGSAANAGFSLIGYSGSGKSSSLEILLSRYPQTIRHETGIDSHIVQIVYLVVVCQTNSNFKALYQAIGRAIDRALGNLNPVYEKEIDKASSLPKKQELVRRYIEQFSIGAIILDEIQLLSFGGNKESSYESLMVLANETKVALIAVGTEEAYDKMFQKLQTSRRLGTTIEADAYCENKKYFSVLANNLFKYQWFSPKVTLTREMIDELYDLTKGIIDQLIGLYLYMQVDYITADKKPEVNAKYIRKTGEKHFAGVLPILKTLTSNTSSSPSRRLKAEKERQEWKAKANQDIENLINSEKQNSFMEEITASLGTPEAFDNRLDTIVENILMVTEEYNESTIKKAAEKVLSAKKYQDSPIKVLTQQTMLKLKSGKTDKRAKPKQAPKEPDQFHTNLAAFVNSND